MDAVFKPGLFIFVTSLVAFAISLGGVIYQHVVEFPNWKKDIPNSLIAFRSFFKHSDFGSFFKLFMPISSISLLIAILLLWNNPKEANLWALMAMAGLILTAAFTNFYFVPRHAKLFSENIAQTPVSELETIATQWGKGNLMRIVIMSLTLVAYLKAYQTIVTCR